MNHRVCGINESSQYSRKVRLKNLKIYTTNRIIGKEFLQEINYCAELGVDGFRFNFDKYKIDDDLNVLLHNLNYIKENLPHVEIMLDFPYPRKKIRILNIGDKNDYTYNVNKNDLFCVPILQGNIIDDKCIMLDSYINIEHFKEGDTIFYSDGIGSFSIDKIDRSLGIFMVANNSFLMMKGKSLSFGLNEVEESYKVQMINIINEINPNFVALSFIETENDIINVMGKSQIISKIETGKGIINSHFICENSDGLMLARGDLALFTNVGQYIYSNDKLKNDCLRVNKKYFIATDILSSILERSFPSRADISDLINIIKSEPYGIILNYSLIYKDKIKYALEFIKEIYISLNEERY